MPCHAHAHAIETSWVGGCRRRRRNGAAGVSGAGSRDLARSASR
jgi:hypothetical protein